MTCVRKQIPLNRNKQEKSGRSSVSTRRVRFGLHGDSSELVYALPESCSAVSAQTPATPPALSQPPSRKGMLCLAGILLIFFFPFCCCASRQCVQWGRAGV